MCLEPHQGSGAEQIILNDPERNFLPGLPDDFDPSQLPDLSKYLK